MEEIMYTEKQKHQMITHMKVILGLSNHFSTLFQFTREDLYCKYYTESEMTVVTLAMYNFFCSAVEIFNRGIPVPYKHFLFILDEVMIDEYDIFDALTSNLSVGQKAKFCREFYRRYVSEYARQLAVQDKEDSKTKKPQLHAIKGGKSKKPQETKPVHKTEKLADLADYITDDESESVISKFLDMVEDDVIEKYNLIKQHEKEENHKLTNPRPKLTIIQGSKDTDK